MCFLLFSLSLHSLLIFNQAFIPTLQPKLLLSRLQWHLHCQAQWLILSLHTTKPTGSHWHQSITSFSWHSLHSESWIHHPLRFSSYPSSPSLSDSFDPLPIPSLNMLFCWRVHLFSLLSIFAHLGYYPSFMALNTSYMLEISKCKFQM